MSGHDVNGMVSILSRGSDGREQEQRDYSQTLQPPGGAAPYGCVAVRRDSDRVRA